MTLSPPVRAAVLEVVRRLRDPMRDVRTDSIGFMILDAMGRSATSPSLSPLGDVREALGLHNGLSTLATWARGKSREEVAQALERVATPEASAR